MIVRPIATVAATLFFAAATAHAQIFITE